ncbi:STAS-like domain-containing protein [Bradyrhizobium elkanii]|uniref:STAS-like domain-containing protein n=1 Tax=Bradyrhizobium elkanii TaxID=29448 RepID=UPI002714C362|nr:DUF4325 domain-containing protein [Bradyrhizobium elkanii]WLA50764.1 DUF4325 domain-containing protein [Bradyrhizobium elkanii]WLB78998.1 DUF4325 domain-containing protein [Bradyrhizobium elkanii]
MVIHVRKLVSGADTADQGLKLFPYIRDAFRSEKTVTVSFDGLQTATSSFVKTAMVGLLNDMAFSEIKARLKIVDSTRQINQMIKSRFEREAMAHA